MKLVLVYFSCFSLIVLGQKSTCVSLVLELWMYEVWNCAVGNDCFSSRISMVDISFQCHVARFWCVG